MNKNNVNSPSIELISGAYSSKFWDNLCDICENEDSPINVYSTLAILNQMNKDKEAFVLVQSLHDLVGLDLPTSIAALNNNQNAQTAYITELLLDIEDMI